MFKRLLSKQLLLSQRAILNVTKGKFSSKPIPDNDGDEDIIDFFKSGSADGI